LDGKKYINEFLISKKLGITINQTRNILYKISDYGLISSIRKKDKRKGWYTYFWRIEIMKSLEFLANIINKRLEQLKNQIKSRETKEFYICEQCNVEFNAENALLRDFTCNECGEVYSLKDSTKMLKELKKEVDKLEGKLKLVQEEIGKEQDKMDKQRTKELKIELVEKVKKKAAASAKRKAAKKKLEKETSKSVDKKLLVKKKVVRHSAYLKARSSRAKKKAPVKKKVIKGKTVKKKIVKKTKSIGSKSKILASSSKNRERKKK